MTLTEFLRNFRNGNSRTAMEWWKPGITDVDLHVGGTQAWSVGHMIKLLQCS